MTFVIKKTGKLSSFDRCKDCAGFHPAGLQYSRKPSAPLGKRGPKSAIAQRAPRQSLLEQGWWLRPSRSTGTMPPEPRACTNLPDMEAERVAVMSTMAKRREVLCRLSTLPLGGVRKDCRCSRFLMDNTPSACGLSFKNQTAIGYLYAQGWEIMFCPPLVMIFI